MFALLYNLQELVGVGSIIFVISLVLIALIVIVYSIYSWNKEINEMNDYEHPSVEPDSFGTQPINPLIHDISDPVVPDFEVAYFDPKSNKSEKEISVTKTISKYSGPKYSLISKEDLHRYMSKFASLSVTPSLDNVIKDISFDNRKEFISPYSFFTELSDKELAKRIDISVSALNNYFNNICSKKTTDKVNEYLKENIKNYKIQ